MSHVRRALASNNGLYTPTHIQLTAEVELDSPPFTLKTVKTNISMGKGKQREISDEDFSKERAWLLLDNVQVSQEVPDAEGFLQDRTPGDVGPPAMDPNVTFEEGGLECGCCFSPSPFVRLQHLRRP